MQFRLHSGHSSDTRVGRKPKVGILKSRISAHKGVHYTEIERQHASEEEWVLQGVATQVLGVSMRRPCQVHDTYTAHINKICISNIDITTVKR